MSGYHCDGAIEDMKENAAELAEAVVGHRIVSVEKVVRKGRYWGVTEVTEITLDNGRRVQLDPQGDCCAYTELAEFFLDPASTDHIITSVTTDDDCETWHIIADLQEVLKLDVSWSEGNYAYYPFGFHITVVEPEGKVTV